MESKDRITVVWNVTRLCPFACSFCCVSAVHIKGFQQVKVQHNNVTAFRGELSLNEQLAIIDQMKADDFRVDFSGGDVLIIPRNINLIVYASDKFGADNVSLSLPGTFLTESVLGRLAGRVSDIEVTLDNIPSVADHSRPLGYAGIAVDALKKLVDHGFRVGAQTVLKQGNMDESTLAKLHGLLIDVGVHRWSILKFFPVGRYLNRIDYSPSDEAYQETVDYILGLTRNSSVNAHFQYLMPRLDKQNFNCRAVSKSIGILPSGTVSACFWALDKHGEPLSGFTLGKLPKDNIYDILNGSRALFWREQSKTSNNCLLLKSMEVRQ